MRFYRPNLYKAPQRRELTEEERIAVSAGAPDPRDAEEAAELRYLEGQLNSPQKVTLDDAMDDAATAAAEAAAAEAAEDSEERSHFVVMLYRWC